MKYCHWRSMFALSSMILATYASADIGSSASCLEMFSADPATAKPLSYASEGEAFNRIKETFQGIFGENRQPSDSDIAKLKAKLEERNVDLDAYLALLKDLNRELPYTLGLAHMDGSHHDFAQFRVDRIRRNDALPFDVLCELADLTLSKGWNSIWLRLEVQDARRDWIKEWSSFPSYRDILNALKKRFG